MARIPSKTKGVLISLRGQQIALGPQTNDKLKSPTELNGSFALVVAEISRKTKGVFAYRLRPDWTASDTSRIHILLHAGSMATVTAECKKYLGLVD